MSTSEIVDITDAEVTMRNGKITARKGTALPPAAPHGQEPVAFNVNELLRCGEGDYRKTLEQKYGEALKLRTYAVVAVSFARLTWEEIPA